MAKIAKAVGARLLQADYFYSYNELWYICNMNIYEICSYWVEANTKNSLTYYVLNASTKT